LECPSLRRHQRGAETYEHSKETYVLKGGIKEALKPMNTQKRPMY